MAHARDLYKTKLCTLYQRGNCPRQSCSFAHGDAELRRFPGGGGFNGRQDSHRSGDLRDRLDRRRSPPHRRRSPSREGRGARHSNPSDRRFSPRDRGGSHSRSPGRRRTSRSFSVPRSPSHKSERRETKKMRVEDPDVHLSDVSADHYGGDDDKHGDEDNLKSSARSLSPGPRDTLQEQLRQVQLRNEALSDENSKLEKYLAKKMDETSILSAQNMELELKLNNSQEEYKRWGSKMKKIIKLYMRCSRAQEEVKKTQSKLRKMVEELPTEEGHRLSTHADDSDYLNLSDVEPDRISNGTNAEGTGPCQAADMETEGNITGRTGMSALNIPAVHEVHISRDNMQQHDESMEVAMAKKKRLHSVREKTRASIRNMQQNGGSFRNNVGEDGDRPSLPNSRSIASGGIEKSGKVDMFTLMEVGPSKERRAEGDVSTSLRSSPVEKVRSRDVRLNLPSTGLAAHAGDFQPESELGEDHSTAGDEPDRVIAMRTISVGLSYHKDGGFSHGSCNPTRYFTSRGDDEEVDVDGLDTDVEENVASELRHVEQSDEFNVATEE